MPRFQRTRGVLRLLALWVAHNYQDEHRKVTNEPLITLGLAPLENPIFRAALFNQLGSDELEIPVAADIRDKGGQLQRFYFMTDVLGSVMGLVDTNGAVDVNKQSRQGLPGMSSAATTG